MEFLGYTHVKPVRRQWEIPVQTPGQYRYNSPGGGSAISRDHLLSAILAALPTFGLHLIAALQNSYDAAARRDRKEPLCRAALSNTGLQIK